MSALFGSLLPYIIAAVAALAAFVGAYLKGKSAGKQSEQAKQNRARLDAIKDRKELDNEIDGLGPADLDARFDRWRVHDDRR